jgi:hypothetical protein
VPREPGAGERHRDERGRADAATPALARPGLGGSRHRFPLGREVRAETGFWQGTSSSGRISRQSLQVLRGPGAVPIELRLRNLRA